MSLIDKISFLRSLLPTLVNILQVILRCLNVVVESETANVK